jgi:hypothetical protein
MKPIKTRDMKEKCNERRINSKRGWKCGENKINPVNAKGREQIFRQAKKEQTL